MGSNTAAHPAGPARTTPGQNSQGAGAEPGGAVDGDSSTPAGYQDVDLTPVPAAIPVSSVQPGGAIGSTCVRPGVLVGSVDGTIVRIGQEWLWNAACASVSAEDSLLRQPQHRQRVENCPASSTYKVWSPLRSLR